jgi:hypothetical protein
VKRMLVLVFATVSVALQAGTLLHLPRAEADANPRPRVRVTVTDLATGEPIKDGDTLTSQTTYEVTVTTTGGDCAGQLAVTALGAAPAPPSVLVQVAPFIIGPAVGGNSVTGFPLVSTLQNDWKISASCHGATKNDFDFASFEFFVDVPQCG